MKYDFVLHYRGKLRPNGRSDHKHDLRKHFHVQLKNYIMQDARRSLIQPFFDRISVAHGSFRFVPLISDDILMAASLRISMLRPGSPGDIITHGGDIDNRLKTLFDSLKIPEPNALPAGSTPSTDEDPFFCLVKDDSLITSVSVSTYELLEPSTDSLEVELFIHVRGDETESQSIGLRV